MSLDRLKKAIYKTYEINEEPRDYIGASMLGHPCERYIWLSFRWVMPEKFEGRMKKLFGVGHREEEIAAAELRNAGVDIRHTGAEQLDLPLAPFLKGHPDGIIYGGIEGIDEYPILWECKTSNSANFEKMVRCGVQIAKPMHYAQMQSQMHHMKIKYALYEMVNKETSELYFELVPYNQSYAEYMTNRAYSTALCGKIPQAKEGTNPDCRYCAYATFCHLEAETTTITCRNCRHGIPTQDGTWLCSAFNLLRDTEQQRQGCDWHILHPDTVPYQLISTTTHSNTFLIKGKELVNGVKDDRLYLTTKNFLEEAFNVSIEGLSTNSDNYDF